jgi:hypothetical protein
VNYVGISIPIKLSTLKRVDKFLEAGYIGHSPNLKEAFICQQVFSEIDS